MPFTASHPAAVLPFARVLPPSALVLGSMAPDLLYYVPLRVGAWSTAASGRWTHQAWAVPTLDLAVALGFWLLWHAVLAAPALAVAPRGLRARLAGRVVVGLRPRADRRGLVLAAAGALVGAATHVAWDELTHAGRWGARTVGWLAATHGPLPGYEWCQYGSSVLGAAVLGVWAVRWWRRTPAVPVPDAVRPGVAAGLVALSLVLAGTVGTTAASGALTPSAWIWSGATRGGAAVLALALGLAVVWHVRAVRGGADPRTDRGDVWTGAHARVRE